MVDTNQQAIGQTTVRDLVAVLFRQKWVILTVFGVTTVSVFLLNLRTPTTFESSARVRVERGRQETSLRPGLQVLPWKEEISSEIETVKSHAVAQRAQEILDEWHEGGDLSRDVRINRGGIAAGVIGESNVIEISYASQDASVCRPATDAVTLSYTEFRQRSMTVPAAASFFQAQIDRTREELDALEAEKESYLVAVGPGGVDNREANVGGLLQAIDHDLMEVVTEVETLTEQVATAHELLRNEKYDAAFFAQLRYENAWALNQLRKEYIDARLERDRLAANLMPQHPDLREASEALLSAQTMLQEEINSTVSLMEQELQMKNTRQARFETQSRQLRSELSAIPRIEVELERLDAAIRLKRLQMEELSTNRLSTEMTRATSPDYTVTQLSPASSPYAKKTKDYVRMVLAPLMSIVVGLLLAFFLDSLDHSLRTPADVEEHLGLPVLAALPESKD